MADTSEPTREDPIRPAAEPTVEPVPGYEPPAGVTQATISAVGKLSEALEMVEQARGLLYAFHRLTGAADFALGDAVTELQAAGHTEIADWFATEFVGRNVIPGRWTFQIIDEYDDTYYLPFREAEQRTRHQLVDGRRHLHEAALKQQRRTMGHPHHEAAPRDR